MSKHTESTLARVNLNCELWTLGESKIALKNKVCKKNPLKYHSSCMYRKGIVHRFVGM